MIFVLDSDFKKISILKKVIDANRKEVLNGENTLSFTTVLNDTKHDKILDGSLYEYGGQYFDTALYTKECDDDGINFLKIEAEHISYRLNRQEYHQEFFAQTGTPVFILGKILEGTPFKVGVVEFDDQTNYSLQEASSRRQILMEFVATLKGEVVFDNFTVSIVKHRGSKDKKYLVKGKHIRTISTSVNKREIELDENSPNFGKAKISMVCEAYDNFSNSNIYGLGDDLCINSNDMGVFLDNFRVIGVEYNPYDIYSKKIQVANYRNGLEDGLYRIMTQAVAKDKLYNGCRIGPEFGFEAVRNDKMARAYFRSDGLVLQSGDGSGNNWKDRLYYKYDSEKDESVLVYDGEFSTESLKAVKAYIGELEVDVAKITEAVIGKLDVNDLIAKQIKANEAQFKLLIVNELNAKTAEIQKLQADTIRVVELIANNMVASETIHAVNSWTEELELNYLRTNFKDRRSSAGGEWNHIHIYDQNFEFNSSILSKTDKEPYKTMSGRTVYWTAIGSQENAYRYFTLQMPTIPKNLTIVDDITKETRPVKVEDYYVMVPKEEAKHTKLKMMFETHTNDGVTNSVPKMIWGVGDGNGGSIGQLYKDSNSMRMEYARSKGGKSAIDLGDKIVLEDGNDKYKVDLSKGQDGMALVKVGDTIKFGASKGGISGGANISANIVVVDHFLSDVEVSSLAEDTLVVVYDPSDTTARYGSSAYDIAKMEGYKGSKESYNSALSQVGNIDSVLDAITGE